MSKREYTVIGFWYGCEAIATGVVEGTVSVSGGDVSAISDEGLWAEQVTADSAKQAEALAIARMEAGL